MKKIRTLVMMLALVALMVPATTLLAFYEDKCPQQCTPSCPCSLPCDGPLGPTTCGAAGQPCTNYWSDDSGLLSFLEPVENKTPMYSTLADAESKPAVETDSAVETTP